MIATFLVFLSAGPMGRWFDTVAAQYGDGNHMDWGDGSWIVMIIVMSAVLIVPVALIVWGLRSFGGGSGGSGHSRNPADIARERLARGEINHEEFERIIAALRS